MSKFKETVAETGENKVKEMKDSIGSLIKSEVDLVIQTETRTESRVVHAIWKSNLSNIVCDAEH